MAGLRKFLRLSWAERWLLIEAALLLEAIRLGMHLLPFRALLRLVARVEAAPAKPRWPGHTSADRVAWVVEVASRHTLGTKTCLAQALAAQVLLARRAYPALIRIGVCGGGRERFQAHAWVECEGKVVIGGSGLEHFTPLTVLEGEGT